MNSSLGIFYLLGITATLLASGGAYLFSHRSRREVPTWVLWTLIVASGYMLLAQYLKYQSLRMYVDFSHWLQILHNIVTVGKPIAFSQEFIVPGTLNYFSAHFVPLMYVLAIPFKLIPWPETLIVLNVALMLSSAMPLYKLARLLRADKKFALLIGTVFLWYSTFQYITLYEFEMLRFSIPILLWMLYFFETRRMVPYILFVLLAMLVREEVGLTIAMFGLYAWLFAKRPREGLIAFLGGLVGFALIAKVIMPFFSSAQGFNHIAAYWFSQFGNTPLEIIQGALTQPLLLAKTVFDPIKLANVFMLFLPLLLLPFAAFPVLISIFANIGVGLLSGSPEHTSYMLYYISPSVPFIFYALLKAWPKITTRLEAKPLMSALFAGVIAANIFFGPSPLSLQFWSKDLRPAPFRTQDFHWSAYRVTDHHTKVEEFVRLIPDDAIVSAEQFLAPRLFKKKGTMIFPQLESLDGRWKAEYVFIDKRNPIKTGVSTVPESWDGLRQNPQMYYDLVEKNTEQWQLLKADNGYYLYKRKTL